MATTACAQPSVEDAGRSGALAQPARLRATSAAGIVIGRATQHDSGREDAQQNDDEVEQEQAGKPV